MTDPNAGLGGSYIIDPATGKRTLEERTETQLLVKIETAYSTDPAPMQEPLQPKPPAEATEHEEPAAPPARAKRGK